MRNIEHGIWFESISLGINRDNSLSMFRNCLSFVEKGLLLLDYLWITCFA